MGSKYVQLNERASSKPRRLSKSEKEEIIERVLTLFTRTGEFLNIAANNIRLFLTEQLRFIELVPESIQQFGETIFNRAQLAKVEYMYPAGAILGEALPSQMMQMTLNTSHKSGSNQGTGFDAIKELVNFRYRLKQELLYVHYRDRVTVEDIYRKRKDLVEVKVTDLIVRTAIDKAGEMEDEIEDWKEERDRLLVFQGLKEDPEKWDDTVIMRLFLDVELMFNLEISIGEVVQAIDESIGYDRGTMVNFVFSSTVAGIIDIYPDDNIPGIVEGLEENGIEIETIHRKVFDSIMPPMLEIPIRGIPGIKFFDPKKVPIISVIPRACRHPFNNRLWFFQKDYDAIRYRGLTLDLIEELLTEAEVFIEEETDVYYLLRFPEGVTDAQQYLQDFSVNNPETSYYVYAVANGVDLISFLRLPGVDGRKSFANNYYIVSGNIGIEAFRIYATYMIHFLSDSSGEETNSRHLELFVDFASNLGIPVGVSWFDLIKNYKGFLSLASSERSLMVLSNASLAGEIDQVTNNVSSAVITGAPIKLGSGSKEIGNIPYQEIERQIMEFKADDIERITRPIGPPTTPTTPTTGPTFEATQIWIKPEERTTARDLIRDRSVGDKSWANFEAIEQLEVIPTNERVELPFLSVRETSSVVPSLRRTKILATVDK